MTAPIGLIVPLAEAQSVARSGRKAANLSRLIAAGFDVPRGFVIASDAYQYHLWAAAGPVASSSETTAEDREALRAAIMDGDIAEDVWSAVARAYEELASHCGGGEPKVAVRSSALHDFAGAYESVLNVRGLENLYTAVKQVWASVWNGRAAAFRARLRPPGEPATAVIVQEMVDRSQWGCALTTNPISGNPNRVVVSTESNSGSEKHFEFDLTEPLSASPHDSPPDRVAALVAERAILIEEAFDSRVEVEWAYDGERLWILQARPLVDVPAYFPSQPTGEDEREVEWLKAGARPVSPLARSLLWEREAGRRRSKLSSGTCEDRRRLVNGYAYRRGEASDELEGRADPARDRVREIARGFRLLEEWRVSRKPRLAGVCSGIIRSDVSSMDRSTLTRSLAAASEAWRQAVDILDEARYASARFPKLLRDFVGSGTDARSLYRRLISGAAETLVARDARLQDMADRFATARRSGRLDDVEWWSAFRREVEAFAREYGYAFADSGEAYDVGAWRSWIEDPEPIFRMIGALARRGRRTSLVTLHHACRASARSAEREAEDMYEGTAAQYFRDLLELARGWLAARIEVESLCALAGTALRLVLIELGRRLVESGMLRSEQDIFFMREDEIRSILAKPGKVRGIRTAGLVAQRKHEVWLQSRLVAPARLRPGESGARSEFSAENRRRAMGQPVGCGVATGRARVARSMPEAGDIENGEILITRSASLAWTPFFGAAGGFACEEADDVWIAPIAADYGIPAVVGCEGIMSAFTSGTRITVDGSAGVVECSRTGSASCEQDGPHTNAFTAELLRKNR